jgi:hypothetical protein
VALVLAMLRLDERLPGAGVSDSSSMTNDLLSIELRVDRVEVRVGAAVTASFACFFGEAPPFVDASLFGFSSFNGVDFVCLADDFLFVEPFFVPVSSAFSSCLTFFSFFSFGGGLLKFECL